MLHPKIAKPVLSLQQTSTKNKLKSFENTLPRTELGACTWVALSACRSWDIRALHSFAPFLTK